MKILPIFCLLIWIVSSSCKNKGYPYYIKFLFIQDTIADGNIIEINIATTFYEHTDVTNGERRSRIYKKQRNGDTLNTSRNAHHPNNNNKINTRSLDTSFEKVTTDADSNIIEIKSMSGYMRNGAFEYYCIGTITHKYDSAHRVVETGIYANEHTPEVKNTFKYDTKGNCIEESSFAYPSNIGTYTVTKKFDEHNILSSMIYVDSDFHYTKNFIFKYDNFDDHGNWQKKSIFMDGKLYEVTERKIKYY